MDGQEWLCTVSMYEFTARPWVENSLVKFLPRAARIVISQKKNMPTLIVAVVLFSPTLPCSLPLQFPNMPTPSPYLAPLLPLHFNTGMLDLETCV